MQKRMFSNPSINLITNFVSPPFFFVSESGVGGLLVTVSMYPSSSPFTLDLLSCSPNV